MRPKREQRWLTLIDGDRFVFEAPFQRGEGRWFSSLIGREAPVLDWITMYAGRHQADPANRVGPVDYSYVFGVRSAVERHDPHIHSQGRRAEGGLLDVAELVREKKTVVKDVA
jgi:hypothetical protein